MSTAGRFVDAKIRQRKVMMFAKRRDPACDLARRTLDRYGMARDVYEVCEIDRRHDCNLIENHFLVICLISQRRVRSLKLLLVLYTGVSHLLTLHSTVKRISTMAA